MKDIKKILADAGLIADATETFKATVDKDTGFLTAPVNLARTGVQYYYGFELGLADRALERIGVYRSEEEVFDKDSLNSFKNLVVTNDHPSEMVTVDNVKELQVGQVSEVVRVGDISSGIVTITDKEQIKKIKDGKIEVSVGYSNDLKNEEGIFENDSYEFIQTHIRANHLAIVDAGRCGSACKLITDSKKESPVKIITIDGIDYEVENDQLAQAIQKQQSAHDAEKEKLEKEKTDAEKEAEEMKKEKEKAEAAKDSALADTLDSDQIGKLVEDRATLLVDARTILGDKMPDCTDCPKVIKIAVVDHINPGLDLKDKSDDYISAAYDMAVEKAKKAKGSLDSLSVDFKNKKVEIKDVNEEREKARDGYMKDQLKLEVV